MGTVYILKLEDNKYYVGKTNNLRRRYMEHVSGKRSSAWTKKYRPIRIINTIPDAHCLDEDKVTVEYMMKYGIENVRGGPYVSIKLSQNTMNHIIRRIRMACDQCVYCGSANHFCTYCPVGPTIDDTVDCKVCKSRTHFTEDCEFSRL